MEVIKNLIIRLRHTGVVLVIGLLLISYIALGVVYWQQGTQQRELEKQIAQLAVIVSRPLASAEELLAEYEQVKRYQAPITDTVAIAKLVDIARESGIDIEGGAFHVPPATFSATQVAGGAYQLMSFSNINVQGDYDSVMAFIADLDSGKTLAMMVLKRLSISQTEVEATGDSENVTPNSENITPKIEVTATVTVDIYSRAGE